MIQRGQDLLLLSTRGQQHGDPELVILALLFKAADQILFLEEDTDKYIARHCNREYQMVHTHLWGFLEGNHEAQHGGMAHSFVESGLDEVSCGMPGPFQVAGDLMQSEQIGMTDHEGRQKNDQPTQPEKTRENGIADAALEVSDLSCQGAPLPEHEEQQETGDEYIVTPLDGFGDDLRPSLLEAGSCHDAVLDGEQTEKDCIDGERLGKRHLTP